MKKVSLQDTQDTQNNNSVIWPHSSTSAWFHLLTLFDSIGTGTSLTPTILLCYFNFLYSYL